MRTLQQACCHQGEVTTLVSGLVHCSTRSNKVQRSCAGNLLSTSPRWTAAPPPLIRQAVSWINVDGGLPARVQKNHKDKHTSAGTNESQFGF